MAGNRKKNGQVQETVQEQVVEEQAQEQVVEEPQATATEEAATVTEEQTSVANEKELTVEREVVFEQEHTLLIYERMVVTPRPGAKAVLVQNLGGGTVYVGGDTGFKNLEALTDGSEKLFEGVSSVYLTSACRPTVRIAHLK